MSLAERIQQGPLPFDEALRIAHQIGDALEAAHEKGIVHRDLKPANIKITPDGTVKVLDFGLAKMAEPVAVGSPSESPTMAMGATIAGEIMGTAAYMAPEQARGKPVDKRADIWAFGVVLYEMLTGRRLYDGEMISDTLAAVLTKEPEWDPVPMKARRLVQRCLAKDPKQRLRDIGDGWELLDEGPGQTTTQNTRSWKFATATLAAIAAVALWAPWHKKAESIEHDPIALRFDLGADISPETIGPAVILSPDGTRLLFISTLQDGSSRLFTRLLTESKATMLPKTDGARAPFFSPNGEWVGFFAAGKLWKVRLDGGDPIPLCEAPEGRGGSWGEDGNIVASLDSLSVLSLVPSEGGKATPLTELGPGEITHRWPQILPGGKAVLFGSALSFGNFDSGEIEVVSLLDRHKEIVLPHGGMYPRYTAAGDLLFVTKQSLFAIPFDLQRLKVRGTATKIGDVSNNTILGSAQYDVSRSGTLAYMTGRSERLRVIQWLDRQGRVEPFVSRPAGFMSPRLAPDGNRFVVMESQATGGDLYVYDRERGGNPTRLTREMGAAYPLWTPDGRFVVFWAAGGMYWTTPDATRTPQALTHSKAIQLPNAFSPDGVLVYSEGTPDGTGEIRTVPITIGSDGLRAGEPRVFLETATFDGLAAVSPDGNWLAYGDTEGGSREVYVHAFPVKGSRKRISTAGGVLPVWSRNGHELFYREDQRTMAVNYTVNGGSFVPDKPQVWSAKSRANLGTARNYDLAPDGEHVVALMPASPGDTREPQSHVKLTLNFFDEVRRRFAQQTK